MNESVIYVDFFESELDIVNDKMPRWLKKIKFILFNKWGKVEQNKNLLKIYGNKKISKRTINNLMKKIKTIPSKNIVLADDLAEKFNIILINSGYNILHGKWIYKFLAYDIVKKICYIQSRNINKLEITVLANKDSEICLEIIKELAKACKILNIVTDYIEKFEKIENILFDEFGININISRNKAKTCLHSDVVLNFDFDVNMLKKCAFKEKSILVQFTKEKFENKSGITILFIKLDIPNRYNYIIKKLSHFNEEILYESFLYYKTSYWNMKDIMEKDNINIRYFMGNNGKITFDEFKLNKT